MVLRLFLARHLSSVYVDLFRIGLPLTRLFKATAHILKAVFSLKNIRRAPGPSGKLRRYAQDLHGTRTWFYIDQKQKASVWPTSMLLQVRIIAAIP